MTRKLDISLKKSHEQQMAIRMISWSDILGLLFVVSISLIGEIIINQSIKILYSNMDLLESLVHNISNSCERERGNSIQYRSRYLFDSAYQQVGCDAATSRSLSQKKSSKNQQANRQQIKLKACFKISYTLTKKFRAIKYFVFVKLEENHPQKEIKQPKIQQINNQNKQQGKKLQNTPQMTEKQKTKFNKIDIGKINKFNESIIALFQRYYATALKHSAFFNIKKQSECLQSILNGLKTIEKVLEQAKKYRSLVAFQQIKKIGIHKQKTQLFADTTCHIFNRMVLQEKKFFLQNLSKFFRRPQIFSVSQVSSERILGNLFQTQLSKIPLSTKASSNFKLQHSFEQTINNQSFAVSQVSRNSWQVFVKSKPVFISSLSCTPIVITKIESVGFNSKCKKIQHTPLRLNRLHKDQIMFSVHDVEQNKLFSVSCNPIQCIQSSRTQRLSVKTLQKQVKSQEVEKALSRLQDCMFSKTQPIFDREKFKHHKSSFFTNQIDRRPSSSFLQSSNPLIKIHHMQRNPQNSKQDLYTDFQKLKLTKYPSKKMKYSTQNSSLTASPYAKQQDNDVFYPRSSIKSSLVTDTVKKIAPLPKFQFPSNRLKNDY